MRHLRVHTAFACAYGACVCQYGVRAKLRVWCLSLLVWRWCLLASVAQGLTDAGECGVCACLRVWRLSLHVSMALVLACKRSACACFCKCRFAFPDEALHISHRAIMIKKEQGHFIIFFILEFPPSPTIIIILMKMFHSREEKILDFSSSSFPFFFLTPSIFTPAQCPTPQPFSIALDYTAKRTAFKHNALRHKPALHYAVRLSSPNYIAKSHRARTHST